MSKLPARPSRTVLALDISSVKIGFAVASVIPETKQLFDLIRCGTIQMDSKKQSEEERVAFARKQLAVEIGDLFPLIDEICYEENIVGFRGKTSAKTKALLAAFNLAVRWQAWDLLRREHDVQSFPIVGLSVRAIKAGTKTVPKSSLSSWYGITNLSESKIANLGVVKTLIERHGCSHEALEALTITNRNGNAGTGVDDTADAILVAYVWAGRWARGKTMS